MMVVAQDDVSQSGQVLHTRPEMQAATTEAKAQCFKLSTLMYMKLPMELRETVYSFLCLEDRRVPIGPYYHFRKYESVGSNAAQRSNTEYHPRSGDLQTELSDGRIRTDHDIYPEDDLVLPNSHIFNADYMGQEVVLELLKMYYENNTFSVCNIEGGLDRLCTAGASSADGAALDFVPLDHIHDLQIRVKCEHFIAKVSSTEEAGPKRRLEELAEKLSFLDRTVESLQIFRSRAQASSHDLNVEFVLMSDLNSHGYNRYYPQLHLTNLLQTIRNAVYGLLHDREHTAVRVTSQDDSIWAFPRNYTGLFKMTKNKWEHEKSMQRPNRDWSSDFWVPPLGWIVLPGSVELMDLGGYIDNSYGHPTLNNLHELLHSRWGINDILRDTASSTPAEDAGFVNDSYWPVGIPFNHRLLQTLIDRGVFEAE